MKIESKINFAYIKDNQNEEIIFCDKPYAFFEKIINLPVNAGITGFFSGCINSEKYSYLWRDPLGLSKLYFYIDPDNNLITSKSWMDLIFKGGSIKSIYAIPKGTLIKYENGNFTKIRSFNLPIYKGESKNIAKKINERILNLFSKINKKIGGEKNEIFLALSGGLDSGFLLEKANKSNLMLTACTLKMPGSQDAELAKKLSTKINTKHLEIKTDEVNMLKALKLSPIIAEDWRDFNVHCAAINLIIAQYLEKKFENPKKELFIITGDLMNEYVCDYKSEEFNGKAYYKLPEIPKIKLQKYLINGLSTSSREDIVFSNYGINTIQPYAIVSDLYLNLNDNELSCENIKRKINLSSNDNWLIDYISGEKLRAQVGSKDTMGMLGLAVNNNINEKFFLKAIAEKIDCDSNEVLDLIYAGNFKVRGL